MPDGAELIRRAKEMRSNPTKWEASVWKALRAKRLDGFKFRRQVVIAPYIVDFVCFKTRIVVELDGSSHEGSEDYDLRRKAWLESQGFRVLRLGTEVVEWTGEEMLGQVWVACLEAIGDPRTPSL